MIAHHHHHHRAITHRIRAAAVDFPLITKRVREYTPSKVVSVDDIAYPSTFL